MHENIFTLLQIVQYDDKEHKLGHFLPQGSKSAHHLITLISGDLQSLFLRSPSVGVLVGTLLKLLLV